MRLRAFIIIAVCASCGSKGPDVKKLEADWKAAATAKDGAAAWKLVDRASKARIVAALEKTRARALKDDAFKQLVAWTLAPADPTLPADEIAQKLLSSQLALAANVRDATFPHASIEDGAWRAELDAMVLADGDVPVVVEFKLPLGPPPTVAPASASVPPPAREPAPAGNAEPLQEVRREVKDDHGRWVVTIARQTAAGKVLWYRKFIKDSDSYTETDLVRHTLTIANDATHELTRFDLAETGEGIAPTRRTEVYRLDKAAAPDQTPVLLRLRYLDDKMMLHVATPDDTVPSLLVDYSQKDTKGADLAKLSPDARDAAIVEKDRMVNDALVGFQIHSTTAAELDKSLDRASTRGNLPEGFASAARTVLLYEQARIADPSAKIFVGPAPRLEVGSRSLTFAALSAAR